MSPRLPRAFFVAPRLAGRQADIQRQGLAICSNSFLCLAAVAITALPTSAMLPTSALPAAFASTPFALTQAADSPGSQDETPPLRATLAEEEASAGFQLLFDGQTLAGWRGNLAVFQVVDGAIVGGNLDNALPNNEFLRSEQTYENFELRLQFKLVGEQANAGVQIRTSEIPDHHEVIGYQADMGDGWWGCLYDESRRNRVLAGPPAEQRDGLVKADEWNDYRILCEGPRIRLWINGQPTVDYTETDDTIPRRGIVALQIHSGPPAVASYRHIRLKVLD